MLEYPLELDEHVINVRILVLLPFQTRVKMLSEFVTFSAEMEGMKPLFPPYDPTLQNLFQSHFLITLTYFLRNRFQLVRTRLPKRVSRTDPFALPPFCS